MQHESTVFYANILDIPLCEHPALLSRFARWLLKLRGWKVVGAAPIIQRFVVISAPHTSNWDFPVALIAGIGLGQRFHWLGKDSLFKFPFGWFMKLIGGIPVDRSRKTNMVDAMVEVFTSAQQTNNHFTPLIPPEATRGESKRWKTGFYHIAYKAGVPIVFGFLDFRYKLAGFGTHFTPSGDIHKDMEVLKAFYADITAKHPHKKGAITIE
jgi:1-acyl-sn-glycerol-3-phosphate acyltransferase